MFTMMTGNYDGNMKASLRDIEYHFTENHDKSKDTVKATLLYLYFSRDFQ
jgi:hypothetical protein